MLIDNNVFYPGKVKYNSFNIDFGKPFIEQSEELNEDLIQVEFDGNYILDISWYPEGDDKGMIIIQLIHNNDWGNPIIKESVLEAEALLKSITKVMAVMKRDIPT